MAKLLKPTLPLFSQLRARTHKQIAKKTLNRLKNNPYPSEEEILIGAFREELEPQVRDAVLIFLEKDILRNPPASMVNMENYKE